MDCYFVDVYSSQESEVWLFLSFWKLEDLRKIKLIKTKYN